MILAVFFMILVFFRLSTNTSVQNTPPRSIEGKVALAQPLPPFSSDNDIQTEAELLHDSGTSLFVEAMRNENAEDKNRALVLLEQSFRKSPSNARYVIDLADAYSQMDDALSINFAIAIYKGLSDENPACDMLLARLADCYAKIYRYNDAFETAARRTWNKNVSPLGAVSQVVLFSVVSGDFKRGISEIRKILASSPGEKEEIELMLASLYAESGEKSQALMIINNVIASLPARLPAALKAREMKKELLADSSIPLPSPAPPSPAPRPPPQKKSLVPAW
jgi:tetratricopeptide (TPR) repeat protein